MTNEIKKGQNKNDMIKKQDQKKSNNPSDVTGQRNIANQGSAHQASNQGKFGKSDEDYDGLDKDQE